MEDHIALPLAMVGLFAAYELYSNYLYFSPYGMVEVLCIALLSIIALFRPLRGRKVELAISAVLVIPAAIILYFVSLGTLLLFQLVSASVAVTLIYLSSRFLLRHRKLTGPQSAVAMLALSVVIGIVAYAVLFSVDHVINTSDEVAYNYYAGNLLLSGVNPYTSSMAPIMSYLDMQPTIMLNGSYEYSYDYPPLSFVSALPISALAPRDQTTFWFEFVMYGTAVCVFSAFLLYYRSGFNGMLLVPIALWLFFIGETAYHVSQYIAVSVLLLLAYMMRDRPLRSGALMGAAACTTQLAWPVIPFFLIMSLRPHGLRHALMQFAACAAVFAAVYAVFATSSPILPMGNMLSVFGVGGFLPSGLDIGEFSIAFLPMPQWYFTLVPVAAYAISLALFYSDARRFRMLLPIAPFLPYFLSFRDQMYYFLPFVPLILAVYYWDEGPVQRGMNKMSKVVLAAIPLMALLAVALGIWLHGAYVSHRMLSVKILSDVNTPAGFEVTAAIMNNYSTNQTISLMVITDDPAAEKDFGGPSAFRIPPGVTFNARMTLGIQPYAVSGNTHVIVVALAPDYIASNMI